MERCETFHDYYLIEVYTPLHLTVTAELQFLRIKQTSIAALLICTTMEVYTKFGIAAYQHSLSLKIYALRGVIHHIFQFLLAKYTAFGHEF